MSLVNLRPGVFVVFGGGDRFIFSTDTGVRLEFLEQMLHEIGLLFPFFGFVSQSAVFGIIVTGAEKNEVSMDGIESSSW